MSDANDKDEVQSSPDADKQLSDRASNFGWGIGLFVAGAGMFANQQGWIKSADWFVPAILIGVAVSYLYKAMKH